MARRKLWRQTRGMAKMKTSAKEIKRLASALAAATAAAAAASKVKSWHRGMAGIGWRGISEMAWRGAENESGVASAGGVNLNGGGENGNNHVA